MDLPMDIYIRVSQLGDRTEDEATEVYEAECREWADREGVTVGEVADETNVSGSVAAADRDLERLVRRIESGESGGIVTPMIDRFGRDVIEGALALKRVAEAGGKLIAVRDGFDSTSSGSKLIFNLRMSIAEDYLDRQRDVWGNSGLRAAERGVWLAPKIPFGYDKSAERRLVVNDAEAEVVRELFERRAASTNIMQLVKWMRERCEDLPPDPAAEAPKGKRSWRPKLDGREVTRGGVRSILASRAYLGEQTFAWGSKKNGGEARVFKDDHPPIVASELWEAAQVKHPFSPRNGRASTALLRGIVYCASCGRRCKVGASGSKESRYPQYVCTAESCPARPGIRASKLDDLVLGALSIAAVHDEPHVRAALTGDLRYREAMQAVEDARRSFEELRDDAETQRLLGIRDYAAALRARKEAVRLAQDELARVTPSRDAKILLAPGVEQTRENVEAALERDHLLTCVDRVVVSPTDHRGRWQPPAERAAIYWAGADEPYEPPTLSEEDAAALKAAGAPT